MKDRVRFSSKRLFLTLMLCACAVILLQNYSLGRGGGFILDVIAVFSGLALSFVFFIPSIILKKKTDADLLMLARQRTPRAAVAVSIFYAAYFAYTATFFLIPYTDMFSKKYYPEVSRCVIALLLIAACVYAATKGANVITRFGIFLFAFAMLTNLLMFGGSLTALDFSNGFRIGDADSLFGDVVYFCAPSFTAVIFACLAGQGRGFTVKQPVIALLLSGLKYSLVLFFIRYALGSYADRQEYRTFVLSRVAHFGAYAGVESFYLALATMSVFMTVSLFFCCVCRSAGMSGSLRVIVPEAVFVFLLNLLTKYNQTAEALLTNKYILLFLTFIAAVVIPVLYLFVWRKFNAEKNKHIITEP